MTRDIRGLSDIADSFDAVIVDQYGVLHDGACAFPGARHALDVLVARHIPVVALTNSGRRAATNTARLARMGFPETLFRSVISSGELARQRLADQAPGCRVCLVAREGERELTDGLDVEIAAPHENADMIVIASVEPDRHARADYARRLAPHAKRGIPALVANPDLRMSVPGGSAFGPGAVAGDYAAAGGPVERLGKPVTPIFDAALAALGGPDPSRVLMIGDSPAHDIAGAASAGIASLLIRSGVQARLPGAAPDYVAEVLRWD